MLLKLEYFNISLCITFCLELITCDFSPTFSDSLTRKISIKSRDAFFNIENPFTCMESEDNDISNCAETNAYIQV